MTSSPFDERRRLETLSRESLAAHQLARLNHLLWQALPNNGFYREKLADSLDLARVDRGEDALRSLDDLSQLPFTLKDELQSAEEANFARNLTFDRSRYARFHHTSGTRGRPLVVLDTADDWKWWLECWQYVLDAAGARSEDCVLLAFSFGPFIGFWSAHDAAVARGCLVAPGGGLGTLARLEMMRTARPAIVCCTPSYALHMAEVAADNQIDVTNLGVRQIIFAGEPGGSVPAMRQRIETAWNTRVLDHSGATEVGPWGYGDVEQRGLHVLESEFIAEFISVDSGETAREGELAELVITNLGRVGCPVIRYRTGDLVRPVWNHGLKNKFVLLDGGVLGRADDMMIVRGVNVFPSSVDQILRGFPDVLEYRLTVTKVAEMDHLRVEVEDRLADAQRIAEELRLRLGLKVEVTCVPLSSLPRFEGKGRRFVDNRPSPLHAEMVPTKISFSEQANMSAAFPIDECRSQFPALKRQINGREAVFFDGPAGSQTPDRVIDAISDYLRTMNANHGGRFASSVESDALLDEAHQAAADLVGSRDPGEVAFGANMTSLTFALSRALAKTWRAGDEVLVSRLDHDANVTPWVLAARDAGAVVKHIEINQSDCTLDMDDFRVKLSPRTRLVAVGCASNAVGTINPVAEICQAAHAVGAQVFLDAVHYAPHALPDVQAWGCDWLACSAYKFFGPHVGVIWGRRELLEALPAYKLRPAPDDLPGKWMTGTQNHECLAGVLAAIDYLADLGRQFDPAAKSRRTALKVAYERIVVYERGLIGQLLAGLAKLASVRIYGITDPARFAERAPTVSITHARMSPLELAEYLDRRGIFIWHGNFYALPLTEALGLEPAGLVRIGLLHYNTTGEVERLLAALAELEQ